MSGNAFDEVSASAEALHAVRLPAAAADAWVAGRPSFGAESGPDAGFEAAAIRLAEFCRHTADLVALLPPKPRRNERETAAAEILTEGARGARTQFMRIHAEQVYQSLTHDYAELVRVEQLVGAAAEAFPGLVPSKEGLRREAQLPQRDKEGLEVDQGLFLSQLFSHPVAGLHLVHAMLRPTEQAQNLLGAFHADGVIDLGPVRLERHGRAGHVLLQNKRYLNAEDDSTVPPFETAVDLVLLDPSIEIGVLRGSTVDHPKYAGRHVFNAGINLTHLYYGKISLVNFFLVRELGLINKMYRGLSGSAFLPDEPESTREKPWIAAVEAFAIGGGCQLLLVMDRVVAERQAFFTLPARSEGFIPGAANLRLPRLVGERLARQAILYERRFAADSPEGELLCDELVESGQMDGAIDRSVETFCESGAAGAVANRRALRVAQEPLDVFRRYMALYAREQAMCHVSPELIRNLEQNWNAQNRTLKEVVE